MYLHRYGVSQTVFEQILYRWRYVVDPVEDLSPYLVRGYNGDKKRIQYLPGDKPQMICRKQCIYYVAGLPMGEDSWMRVLVYPSENIDTMQETVWASKAESYMYSLLSQYYSDEEIEECFKTHSIDEHVKPIHEALPYYYETNKIHEFHNCCYYDINNAHLTALCIIFPKATYALHGIRTKINNYKAQGNYAEAQKLKDIVNIFCGNLGKHEGNGYASTRGTYEWIVQWTRSKLSKAIEEVGGILLYANTDGFIVKAPLNKLKTSKELGDFKSELSDDTIYVINYRPESKDETGYSLYQYMNSKGEVEKKGTFPVSLRNQIDLSKGIAASFKRSSYKSINSKGKEVTTIQEKIIEIKELEIKSHG